MASLPTALSARPSHSVDGGLIQVRWLLAALSWLVIAVSGSRLPGQLFVFWLGLLIVLNLAFILILRKQELPRALPVWGIIADFVLFGSLPYLANANTSVLFLFGLFPALVAALRYGTGVGSLVAAGLALPYGMLALAEVKTPLLNALPVPVPADVNFFSAGPLLFALFASILLVGFIGQRQREALVGDSAVELEHLRRGMEGARLFFQTTDTLSQTLSYSRVLDAMLDAGIRGMPPARREDGPAVGFVLFFEANDPKKQLGVVAWRHLDRIDTHKKVEGKEGIVGRTLEEGLPVTFTELKTDPELSQFVTLRHCRAGACFPLQSGLDLYGVVLFASPAPRLPSEEHLDLMKAFTNQAAVAFQNARLYQSLREERDHIIDAEASARARLARDLHDGPTQKVAAIAMRLDIIGKLLDKDAEKARTELSETRESAIQTGKELRNLLFTLRPLTLETQGLTATLQLWAVRLREHEGVPLDIAADEFGPQVDPKMAGTVFAIVEEAVNNARKHGRGAPIHVSVRQHEGNLVAIVQDEGPGFDLDAVQQSYEQRGSLGLVNMRERARLLDGHLSIDSAPGRGTRVMLLAPLASAVSITKISESLNAPQLSTAHR